MPGMAEPDIAIDIAGAATGRTQARTLKGDGFAPRARLAGRTAGLIGLDAGVTACVGLASYAMLNPAREVTATHVVLPMACLTISLILCFFERGLYDAAEVMSRTLPWRKICVAW